MNWFSDSFIYCDDYISLLHQFHYSTIALALKKDSIPIDSDILKQDKLAIILGNEGEGVSRLVKESCDMQASIPMKGELDSLNASVACGVLAYEIVRQRLLQNG